MKYIKVAVVLLVSVVIFALVGRSQEVDVGDATEDIALTWQEQYDLGMKYLSDGNYQEAIIAFKAAIALDPKNAEAYLGLADAYVAEDYWENALSILEEGYALMGDDDIAAYYKVLQENYLVSVAPNLITDIETMLAFHMFAQEENPTDVDIYRYDFSGDGELDWMLQYFIENSYDLHEVLYYSNDGGVTTGAINTVGNAGTMSSSYLYWSQSEQCIIKENLHTTYRTISAYDHTWTELAKYTRETVNEAVQETYTIENQGVSQEIFDTFEESLQLIPMTSEMTLAQMEQVSVELDVEDLGYLHATLMNSPIYAYSEKMDLDGDGVNDYMLHTGDTNSSWEAAGDELHNQYPVWCAKTLVIFSNNQTPYACVVSSDVADELRTNHFDTSTEDTLPVVDTEESVGVNWAEIFWESVEDTSTLPILLQSGVRQIGFEDFDFDGIPELVLVDSGAGLSNGVYIFQIAEDGTVVCLQEYGISVGDPSAIKLLETADGIRLYMIESSTSAGDRATFSTVLLNDETGAFAPYVYLSLSREYVYDESTGLDQKMDTHYKDGEPVTQEEYAQAMEKLEGYTEIPYELNLNTVEPIGADATKETYNKAVGIANVKWE